MACGTIGSCTTVRGATVHDEQASADGADLCAATRRCRAGRKGRTGARLRIPSETSYKAIARFPLEPGKAFVDIGANRGQTIKSIRLYRAADPIVSFEPNPRLAQRLVQRYRSDRNLTVNAFGLGIEPGEFSLHVPSYRGFVFDGLASFEREAAQDWFMPSGSTGSIRGS